MIETKVLSVTAGLPFGKHAGCPLPDVPTDYLQWVIRECKLSSGLRGAVAAVAGTAGAWKLAPSRNR
jgi:uncharacterized protein (DUF3820 family)